MANSLAGRLTVVRMNANGNKLAMSAKPKNLQDKMKSIRVQKNYNVSAFGVVHGDEVSKGLPSALRGSGLHSGKVAASGGGKVKAAMANRVEAHKLGRRAAKNIARGEHGKGTFNAVDGTRTKLGYQRGLRALGNRKN